MVERQGAVATGVQIRGAHPNIGHNVLYVNNVPANFPVSRNAFPMNDIPQALTPHVKMKSVAGTSDNKLSFKRRMLPTESMRYF